MINRFDHLLQQYGNLLHQNYKAIITDRKKVTVLLVFVKLSFAVFSIFTTVIIILIVTTNIIIYTYSIISGG